MRVKICGIRCPDAARHAIGVGADALGLNFFPGSPRAVDLKTASAIAEISESFHLVGVYVRPSADWLMTTATACRERLTIQLHEPDRKTLAPLLREKGWPVILARGVAQPSDLVALQTMVADWQSQGVRVTHALVDARVPGQYGGTGRAVPWNLLIGFHPGVPLLLAGGLTPDNVASAIQTVRPHGVDVASGVESIAGVKDPIKVEAFVSAARVAWGLPPILSRPPAATAAVGG